MLSDSDRQQLLGLMQSPQWRVVDQIADNLAATIESESTVRDSEWETIRATLLKEGQSTGVRKLINELYKYAKNDV